MPRRAPPPQATLSPFYDMTTDEDSMSLDEEDIHLTSFVREREAGSSQSFEQLNADLEHQATMTILSMTANMNKNTLKTYKSAVKKWDIWCARKGFADGCQVNERKLNSYVREEVTLLQILQ